MTVKSASSPRTRLCGPLRWRSTGDVRPARSVVETFRRTTAITSLGFVAVLLGACASGAASGASSVVTSPAAPAKASNSGEAAPSEPASPSASVIAAVDCEGLGTTTAAITSAVHDVGALVGTTTDPTAIMAGLPSLQATLAKVVPACNPDAEPSMWLVDAALTRLREQYRPGRDRTSVAADRALLLTTRIAGNVLFEHLGTDPAAWQDVPRKARMACPDLEPLGPSLSTAVLELSHLVGSTNDASSYLATVSGQSSAITDLAPKCEPGSKDASAELASAVRQLMTDFMPGTEQPILDTDKAALNDVRAAGIALYKLLDLNSAGWENIPAEAR